MSTKIESPGTEGQDVQGRAARLQGKYLTFKLADEEYGLEILKVREIIGMMDVTRVPRTQDFIHGVINLRGKVIPVVDVRVKFQMAHCQTTDQTVIIVVQYSWRGAPLTMGLLVDQVLEVLNISESQIEPPPVIGFGTTDATFILAIGKADKRIIYLLDIGKVMTSEESQGLVQIGNAL